MVTTIFLYNLLRILKKKNGMSKADLAEALGVHVGTVNNWFQRERMPETPLLQKIIEVLEIEPHELFLPMDSVIEIEGSKSELLTDAIIDAGKLKQKEDELLLAIVLSQLSPSSKAFVRYNFTHPDESVKLMIKAQEVRLLEMAQKVSGLDKVVSSSETSLLNKLSQMNEIQQSMIEAAIDGILLSSQRKISDKASS